MDKNELTTYVDEKNENEVSSNDVIIDDVGNNESLTPLNLDLNIDELTKKILDENNINKLEDFTSLFSIAQTKKSVVRLNSLNTLLDAVQKQALDRVTNNPDEISTKELISFIQVVQNSIDKTRTAINEPFVDASSINLTQSTNKITVNINDTRDATIKRESRDKIIDVVQSIIKAIENSTDNNLVSDASVIDDEINTSSDLNVNDENNEKENTIDEL